VAAVTEEELRAQLTQAIGGWDCTYESEMQGAVDEVVPVVHRYAQAVAAERAPLRRILAGARVFAEPGAQPAVLSLGSALPVDRDEVALIEGLRG
jgi:hypothetical protein